MTTIRSVIFDIDDTLYSYTAADPIAKAELYRYCEEQDLMSKEESETLHNYIFHEQARRLGDHAASHNRLIRYQMMLEEKGLPVFPHALTMTKLYWGKMLEIIRPEPGIVDLFRALHEAGITVGIGTNMTSFMQFEKLEKLGLAPYIDFVTTSEDAGAEKPSPAFFDAVLKKANAAPGECIFIGDSIKHDMEGALVSGLNRVLYEPDWMPKKQLPDSLSVIHNFSSCLTDSEILLGDFRIPFSQEH